MSTMTENSVPVLSCGPKYLTMYLLQTVISIVCSSEMSLWTLQVETGTCNRSDSGFAGFTKDDNEPFE